MGHRFRGVLESLDYWFCPNCISVQSTKSTCKLGFHKPLDTYIGDVTHSQQQHRQRDTNDLARLRADRLYNYNLLSPYGRAFRRSNSVEPPVSPAQCPSRRRSASVDCFVDAPSLFCSPIRVDSPSKVGESSVSGCVPISATQTHVNGRSADLSKSTTDVLKSISFPSPVTNLLNLEELPRSSHPALPIEFSFTPVSSMDFDPLSFDSVFDCIRRIDSPTLNHIPKRCRGLWGAALREALNLVLKFPHSLDAHARLQMLPKCVLMRKPKSLKGISFNAYLRPRIQKWMADDAGKAALWKDLRDLYEDMQTTQVFRSLNCTQQNINRCKKLVSLGRLSAAAAALTSEGVHVITDEILAALKAKFPSQDLMSFMESLYVEFPHLREANPLQVSNELVLLGITSFPAGTGCGRDGLRAEHLKDAVQGSPNDRSGETLSCITKYVNLLLSGDIPELLFSFIGSAPVIPLKKKDGGIRPIAIGEIWRRLTSKIAARSVRDRVTRYLAPSQLGVGVPNGCEGIIHSVDRLVSEYGDNANFAMLKIDYANAFNSVSRKAFIHAASKICPDIIPWIMRIYCCPSVMFAGDHQFTCTRGVQQGDPLGPILFSLAIQPMVEQISASFPDLKLNAWFLDDGTLIGESQVVGEAFSYIMNASKEMDLELNLSKCEVWWPSLSKSSILNFPRNISFTFGSGTEILGSCVGDMISKQTLLQKRVDKIANSLEALAKLEEPQIALHLLRSCFSLPKINFALRTLHFSENCNVIQDFDRVVDSALDKIMGFKLSDVQRDQAALPFSEGFPGFGLPKAEPTSHCAYLASSVQSLSIQESLLRRENLEISPLAKLSLDRINSFLEPSSQVHLHHLQGLKKPQHELASRLAKAALGQILEFFSTEKKDLARILSCCMRHSGGFLQVLPNPSLGLFLPKIEFETLCRFRLGQPIFNRPSPCIRCNKLADVYGIHSSQCAKGGLIIRRHDAIRDELAKVCREAHCTVIVEQRGLFDDTDERPGDLRVKNDQINMDVLIDVSVTSPLSDSSVHRASKAMGYAASHMESLKIDKYRDRLQVLGTNFSPFVFETFGGWTSFGDSLISQVAGCMAHNTNAPISECVSRINNRISLVLARQMAAILVSSFPLLNYGG